MKKQRYEKLVASLREVHAHVADEHFPGRVTALKQRPTPGARPPPTRLQDRAPALGNPVIEELASRVRSGDASKENLDRIRELLDAATRGDGS